jgi:outer membrane protein OmpA-like peptidoglycan-associated protein
MALRIVHAGKSQNESQWLSVADMMSGLMMIFILLAISFISRYVDSDKDTPIQFDMVYAKIAEDLVKEFGDDLRIWNAKFDGQLLEFQFTNEAVMFDSGKSEIKDQYKMILTDFFPRYLDVLKPHRPHIREIRIEGHTSSEWGDFNETESYFENMRLSQERTREVLEFVYQLPALSDEGNVSWVRSNVVAVGLSSSKKVVNNFGIEDPVKSRRVTFRIITNAEQVILCELGIGPGCSPKWSK